MNEKSLNKNICTMILLDEGIFLQRIIHQHKYFPNEAAILSLVALPFIATIEHDSIPYLMNTYGVNLFYEKKPIARIRHLAKSVDPLYLPYQEYSKQVLMIMEESYCNYNKDRLLNSLELSFANDIGIFYYGELPIFITQSIIYSTDDNGYYLVGEDSGNHFLGLGYKIGSAGAILYALADQLIEDRHHFPVPPFKTVASDHRYSVLSNTMMIEKGIKDKCAFYFLSELMARLASIEALRRGGFLNELLWIKLSIIFLYQVHKSIGVFSGHVHQPDNEPYYSIIFKENLHNLFDRRDNKIIKRLKKLRNAFMHYDFVPLLDSTHVECSSVWDCLDYVIRKTTDMSYYELKVYLEHMYKSTIERLANLSCFPKYGERTH